MRLVVRLVTEAGQKTHYASRRIFYGSPPRTTHQGDWTYNPSCVRLDTWPTTRRINQLKERCSLKCVSLPWSLPWIVGFRQCCSGSQPKHAVSCSNVTPDKVSSIFGSQVKPDLLYLPCGYNTVPHTIFKPGVNWTGAGHVCLV